MSPVHQKDQTILSHLHTQSLLHSPEFETVDIKVPEPNPGRQEENMQIQYRTQNFRTVR